MTDSLLFPTEPIRTKDQIEKDYLLVKNTTAEDSSRHFEIALTRQWKMMNISTQPLNEENPLVTLALFRRFDNPEAEIEVIAAYLPREVDPANWLAIHLKNHRFKILQMHRLPSPTGEVGDILSELTHESGTYLARSLAIKDGARVFAVVCQVESSGYERVAEEFYMAISKFNLLSPNAKKFAEPMQPRVVFAPVECNFLFPVSWVEKKDTTPPYGGTSFSLVNLNKNSWAGQFTFAAIRHDDEKTYQGLYANYLEQLKLNGIEAEPAELTAVSNVSGFAGMWAGVFSASSGEDSFEVRCCILEHSKAWFMFAVIGPDWASDPEAQSINYRAFRISLESLSVG